MFEQVIVVNMDPMLLIKNQEMKQKFKEIKLAKKVCFIAEPEEESEQLSNVFKLVQHATVLDEYGGALPGEPLLELDSFLFGLIKKHFKL
jgi:Mg2+/Co2+ transporter CorB